MKLKGIEKFREKVPMLSGWKIFLLPLYALSIMFLSIFFMIGFDSIPNNALNSLDPALFAFSPLLGELIVCFAGFILVFQMWFWKDRLKAKCGQLAYQRIFLVGFAGISCVLSLAINLFVHYWSFSSFFWANSQFKLLATPIEEYFPSFFIAIIGLKITLVALFTVLGLTMVLRSLFTFGFDYMSVIYLYFPEESEIQEHAIYSLLRHPTYTGALLIGLGGMFSTLTVYSVIFYLVFLAGFYIHIHFVEERELISRFGPSYKEYIKRVPAFLVKPNKWRIFFSFLSGNLRNSEQNLN